MLQCTLKLNILQNVLEKVILGDYVADKSTDKNVRPDWYRLNNFRSFAKQLCMLLVLNYFSLIWQTYNVIWWRVCPNACPLGKWPSKITCPTSKCTCPGRPDGTFVEPWSHLRISSTSSRVRATMWSITNSTISFLHSWAKTTWTKSKVYSLWHRDVLH